MRGGVTKELSLATKGTVRWPVVGAALGEAARASLARVGRLVRPMRRVRTPARLLFAPQDLRAADPMLAGQMAAGLFVFADRHPPPMPGRSPFEVQAPSWAWAEALYGFGWLRDLKAADSAEARKVAGTLTMAALRSGRRVLERGVARRPAVVARRVISMLAHSPLLLTETDHNFYHRYLRRIARDASLLRRAMRDAPAPGDRLAAAIGLAYAGLSAAGLETHVRRASRTLELELARQVVAEGAPLARSPGALVELLLDLLPLRLLYESRALPVPSALERAIEGALPMLASMRHGNGELALFNGTGPTHAGDLAIIFSDDRAPASARTAPGYARLEAGRTLVLADVGPVPPLAFSAGHHAGPLAFEMSSGQNRIIVNSGAPPHPGPAREAARRTPSHSTLVLDGESAGTLLELEDGARGSWAASSLVRQYGPVLIGGARDTGAVRQSDDGATTFSAHHDGYARSFGATHTRTLRLSADGGELEGEDAVRFSGRAAYPAARAVLHFHLHPSVQAREEEGGAGIVLDLPDGERWRFGADGASPRLAPSLFFAVTEGRRATQQIVVELPKVAGDAGSSLRWLFIRT